MRESVLEIAVRAFADLERHIRIRARARDRARCGIVGVLLAPRVNNARSPLAAGRQERAMLETINRIVSRKLVEECIEVSLRVLGIAVHIVLRI